MSSLLSELGGFTAGVGAEGLAFAAGFAASHALEPEAVTIRQAAWNDARVLRIPPEIAAEIAAEEIGTYDDMQTEAHYYGWDDTRFPLLYHLSLVAPGTGELLNMLRRGTIGSDDFTHGLRKGKLEPRWDDAIRQLAVQYIGLGDIATAIVRGAVPAPSWVPVAPPATTDNVPRFPVTDIDPVALAAKLGYDEDMLRIMTARSGLSLAPILATQALFRGALTANDWLLAIAEGDLRTEWAETLKEAARAIPSPGEFAEWRLRGFTDQAGQNAGAALHGMIPDYAEVLYDLKGRAPNIHAVTTGLARGGTYDGQPKTIPEPFLSAVQRADIRPEWYDLEYANRYTYPSAFVLRSLAEAGDLGDTAAVEQLLLEIGWKPELAAKVAAKWVPTGTALDPNVKKAHTKAWTEAQSSYIAEEVTAADLAPIFALLGISPDSQTELLAAWDAIRALNRKQATPAKLIKGLKDGATNASTGLPFTEADVLAALEARGYSATEAQDLVNIG